MMMVMAVWWWWWWQWKLVMTGIVHGHIEMLVIVHSHEQCSIQNICCQRICDKRNSRVSKSRDLSSQFHSDVTRHVSIFLLSPLIYQEADIGAGDDGDDGGDADDDYNDKEECVVMTVMVMFFAEQGALVQNRVHHKHVSLWCLQTTHLESWNHSLQMLVWVMMMVMTTMMTAMNATVSETIMTVALMMVMHCYWFVVVTTIGITYFLLISYLLLLPNYDNWLFEEIFHFLLGLFFNIIIIIIIITWDRVSWIHLKIKKREW